MRSNCIIQVRINQSESSRRGNRPSPLVRSRPGPRDQAQPRSGAAGHGIGRCRGGGLDSRKASREGLPPRCESERAGSWPVLEQGSILHLARAVALRAPALQNVCRNVCRSDPANAVNSGRRTPVLENKTAGPHGTRRLFSPLLYQLSYLARNRERESRNETPRRQVDAKTPQWSTSPASAIA
jgi:hypothetical protein